MYADYLDANGVGNTTQPDHIGTGSEDYYGYAWGHTETFSRPFIAQPIGQAMPVPACRSTRAFAVSMRSPLTTTSSLTWNCGTGSTPALISVVRLIGMASRANRSRRRGSRGRLSCRARPDRRRRSRSGRRWRIALHQHQHGQSALPWCSDGTLDVRQRWQRIGTRAMAAARTGTTWRPSRTSSSLLIGNVNQGIQVGPVITSSLCTPRAMSETVRGQVNPRGPMWPRGGMPGRRRRAWRTSPARSALL